MPVCQTDPHRVEQILVNLLANADPPHSERSKVRVEVDGIVTAWPGSA